MLGHWSCVCLWQAEAKKKVEFLTSFWIVSTVYMCNFQHWRTHSVSACDSVSQRGTSKREQGKILLLTYIEETNMEKNREQF